jgi:hypothetical protein
MTSTRCSLVQVSAIFLVVATGVRAAKCPASLAGCGTTTSTNFAPRTLQCAQNAITKVETEVGCCYYMYPSGAPLSFQEATTKPLTDVRLVHQDEIWQYKDVLCGRGTEPTGPTVSVIPATGSAPGQPADDAFAPCPCNDACFGSAAICVACCAHDAIPAGIKAATQQCAVCSKDEAEPAVGGSSPPTTSGSDGARTAASKGTAVDTSGDAATKKKTRASSCFPAGATVELEGGAVVPVDTLAVGDRVHVGHGQFSEVFMFTHRVADHAGEYVEVATATGAVLRATSGHYLYVNGGLVPAGSVTVGDTVELGRGGMDVVARVSTVLSTGLYNPQTVHGDVVVDGVRASTYTTAVAPALAHAALAPVRAVFSVLGWSTAVLDGGSPLAALLPSGPAACR